ncbi:aspartyl-phosphate phosphatase Spo0E family protein [Priestia aryabhattai]|uniref:aspartyl-phosphate phosphatase Spo0E family protein n=1 Tax=Priestia aryabhattai TaxID=412384 RepID=UPI003D29A6AD
MKNDNKRGGSISFNKMSISLIFKNLYMVNITLRKELIMLLSIFVYMESIDKIRKGDSQMLLSKAIHLSENIKKLKFQMYTTASQKGINSKEALMISQALDKEIAAMQKICSESAPIQTRAWLNDRSSYADII